MVAQPRPLQGQPKVILACICADFHAAGGGGFNIIRVYDSLGLQRPPQLPPEVPVPVMVQAVTCWTEGIGEHTHQLRILDEDAQPVFAAPPVTMALADFSRRHWILDRIILQVMKTTNYAVEISLNGDPDLGLKYVFPITLT